MNLKRPKVEPIRQPTLFQMQKLDHAAGLAGELTIERPYSLPGILLGTSAFTADGWQGSFYPNFGAAWLSSSPSEHVVRPHSRWHCASGRCCNDPCRCESGARHLLWSAQCPAGCTQILAITVHLLASFMMVVPRADLSAATGNRFLGRYQSGRDDDSPCADKEKYEYSK